MLPRVKQVCNATHATVLKTWEKEPPNRKGHRTFSHGTTNFAIARLLYGTGFGP